MTFKQKWLEAVKRKNSVLCAGLDPAVFEMGRGDEGLPQDRGKLGWSAEYINTIAPFCAAVKPNVQYWKGREDAATLVLLTELAHDLGMVVIRDDKLADIGPTNGAGMFYVAQSGADAVTFSPFAGNMKEAAGQGKKYGLGVIAMCLMSNPEYKAEKGKLLPVSFNGPYDPEDLVVLRDNVDAGGYVRQYLRLANDAEECGIDGIVIGAPSGKNHITEEEIKMARKYAGDEMLVLLPGVGAQGGEASAIWKYFRPENVIVNVGRAVMFPNGSKSTPEQQAAAAKQYMEMLNNLRKAA